jgi:hypothetical protein
VNLIVNKDDCAILKITTSPKLKTTCFVNDRELNMIPLLLRADGRIESEETT